MGDGGWLVVIFNNLMKNEESQIPPGNARQFFVENVYEFGVVLTLEK